MANSATAPGNQQAPQTPSGAGDKPLEIDCETGPPKGYKAGFEDCQKEELCSKIAELNSLAKAGKLQRRTPADQKDKRKEGNKACRAHNYQARKGKAHAPALSGFMDVSDDCKQKLKNDAEANDYRGYSPDHVHEIQVGGHPTDVTNLKWLSSNVNEWIGRKMADYKTDPPDANTGVHGNCCD